jgi:hypothetical protein
LLVGGLLPYRARKVRYFLDRRFRDRAGLPPPDGPQEQSRELLAKMPSEWAALAPMPSQGITDFQPQGSALSGKPEGYRQIAKGFAASGPQASPEKARSADVLDGWASFHDSGGKVRGRNDEESQDRSKR